MKSFGAWTLFLAGLALIVAGSAIIHIGLAAMVIGGLMIYSARTVANELS